MGDVDVSLGAVIDASGHEIWQAKIASDSFEVNVLGSLEELSRLEAIREAHWDDRTCLRVGTCLRVAAFWCANDEHDATLMVGGDDEVWDIAVIIPVGVVDDLVSQAREAASRRGQVGLV